MNRVEFITGIAGLALSAVVSYFLGSWSLAAAIIWEIIVIVLVITVVFASSRRITVPAVTPLKEQSDTPQMPEARDSWEMQIQELGFFYIGDFDVKMMAKVSTCIRAYISPDRLCEAILIDITSGKNSKTILEFCTRLYPSGSITTTNDTNPNIIAYQPDKVKVNVPWKRTAADIYELHRSLCLTAQGEKFTPAVLQPSDLARSIRNDTLKDYEYQVEARRLKRIAEGQYRLTLLESIIAAPILWYQMIYGHLFSWYALPDDVFRRRLRKRLHRFKRKAGGFRVLKLLSICIIAALHETWKHLRHGRVSPERNLGLEICVTATRNMLKEMNKWPPARMQAIARLGMPRMFCRKVEISRALLGGIQTERTVTRGDGKSPVVLYIHGGGMVMCSPRSHRDIISHIAVAAGACVYAPDYGLAPQNPFPAGIQDVFIAYRALLEQGIQPKRIIVAGDSAGGTFTLALLLKLRQAGLPYPAAAVTLSPGPDLTFPGESWTRNAATDCLPLLVVRNWMSYYTKPDQIKDPLASPTYGDFAGFPPILVQAGTAECFYDDIVLLVDKMKAAGVDVTFESYTGMPHVWHLYRAVTPQGNTALQSIAGYIIAHTEQTISKISFAAEATGDIV